MTTLQDIMGLITKRKIKTPSDNDYIISAAYSDTQERLKPQPKMEASLLSLEGIKKYVLASIAPPKYKVFTALLTQSGGDISLNNNYQNQLPLVIGASYYIDGNLPLNQKGTDFTNVGAANNDNQTWFIATGTTPIWGTEAGEVISNEGAPVVNVLDNTIGNIWLTYSDVGDYIVNSNNLFTIDKTTSLIGNGITNLNFSVVKVNSGYNASNISISSYDISAGGSGQYDNILSHTTLEIRVYN